MKILIVNKYYYRRGGADAHAIDLQELLERRGHATVFFGMRHPLNRPTVHARYFVSEVDYSSANPLHLARAALRMLYSPQARRRIGRLLADERPDLAHLHNIYHQISPSVLPPLQDAGVPVVMTIHDLKLVCPSYRMFAYGRPCERCRGGRFYQAALTACHNGSRLQGAWLALEMYLHHWLGLYRRAVDLYLCPSRFYANKLRQHGVPAERIRELPYFLDAGRYVPRYGGGDGLVYFGRLSAEKGLETLLGAIAEMPGVRLLVVGEGPLGPSLRRLATPLGGRVVFTGRLRGPALHAAVQSARAAVLPSEWYENCPVSVLEAFALGRPVVASNQGGLPELITPGETGWLFEAGSRAGLVEALSRALEASGLDEMGRRCRSLVEREFSPDAFYARLRAAYRDAAARHGTS